MGKSDSRISKLGDQLARPGNGPQVLSRFGRLPANRQGILKEEAFHAMLTVERRRAERSRNPFVLMLLDSHAVHKNGSRTTFIERLASIVSGATRETDIIGWYEEGTILAVIFTEINQDRMGPVAEVLHSKVMSALRENLDHRFASNLAVSVQVVPEKLDKEYPLRVADNKLYPELPRSASKKRASMIVMRAIDIVGSGV